ncbi:MAG: hypothetical protein RLY40_360 [Pseudomonadota bacterium]
MTLLSLFCTLSAQAATCPSLDEIKTHCIKNKRFNVCSFSAESQGKTWFDSEKYTGIDLPGKITHFIDVEFKVNSVIKNGQLTGNLNSCVYATDDGLEIFLNPNQTNATIQLDGNWKKATEKTYYCNKSIPNCQFEFISKK